MSARIKSTDEPDIISREVAWAHATTIADREVNLTDAEREEAEAWLRGKAKAVWSDVK